VVRHHVERERLLLDAAAERGVGSTRTGDGEADRLHHRQRGLLVLGFFPHVGRGARHLARGGEAKCVGAGPLSAADRLHPGVGGGHPVAAFLAHEEKRDRSRGGLIGGAHVETVFRSERRRNLLQAALFWARSERFCTHGKRGGRALRRLGVVGDERVPQRLHLCQRPLAREEKW
jgi:hypothetical protein